MSEDRLARIETRPAKQKTRLADDFDPADMTTLFTADTGLPMVISVRPRWGVPHDARVKVWPEHGDDLHRHRGGWVSVRVRPHPQIVRRTGTLSADDADLVYRWIGLNEAVITDFWRTPEHGAEWSKTPATDRAALPVRSGMSAAGRPMDSRKDAKSKPQAAPIVRRC